MKINEVPFVLLKKSLSRTKEYTEDLNDNKYNVIQCKEKVIFLYQ